MSQSINCVYCGGTFSNRISLANHFDNVHKGQSPNIGDIYAPNQKAQKIVNEILDKRARAMAEDVQSSKSELSVHAILTDVWVADPYKESINEILPPAQTKLLQLALSCSIERYRHTAFCAVNMRGFQDDQCTCGAFQANAAIDTIEQQIRAKFQ